MSVLLFAFLIIPALVLLWKYLNKGFGYFAERGIPYEKGWPFIGSAVSVFMQIDSNPDWFLNLATKYRGKK